MSKSPECYITDDPAVLAHFDLIWHQITTQYVITREMLAPIQNGWEVISPPLPIRAGQIVYASDQKDGWNVTHH